jgi:hypothetical protein
VGRGRVGREEEETEVEKGSSPLKWSTPVDGASTTGRSTGGFGRAGGRKKVRNC